eukprot:1664872-Lingulodinium_polyedra.AAC.1
MPDCQPAEHPRVRRGRVDRHVELAVGHPVVENVPALALHVGGEFWESSQGPSRKSRAANCWRAMSETLRLPVLSAFT